MSKFKKDGGKKELPAISTSSLPDIVFMLLFFFMVATKMRDQELKVTQTLPQVTQLQKIEDKSLNEYIYIGTPKETNRYGTQPVVQVNDVIVKPEDIITFAEQERSKRVEVDKNKMVFSLKIDRDAKMGIVTDVKMSLRKVNARKINYSANAGVIGGEK